LREQNAGCGDKVAILCAGRGVGIKRLDWERKARMFLRVSVIPAPQRSKFLYRDSSFGNRASTCRGTGTDQLSQPEEACTSAHQRFLERTNSIPEISTLSVCHQLRCGSLYNNVSLILFSTTFFQSQTVAHIHSPGLSNPGRPDQDCHSSVSNTFLIPGCIKLRSPIPSITTCVQMTARAGVPLPGAGRSVLV